MKRFPMRFLVVASVILTIFLASCNGGAGSKSGSSRKPNVYVLPANKSLDNAVSDKKMSVVSFTLPGNRICGTADSTFKLASARFPDVQFISVDVNLHQDLIENLKIEAIPAVLVIHKNGQKDWHIGPMTADELDFAIKDAQE